MTKAQFGKYVKGLREKRDLSLREFCRLANLDPSNWSKVERGVLAPPRSRKCLNDIASVLMVTKDSAEWHTLFDMAAIGHIPGELVSTPKAAEILPIFLRSARGADVDAKMIMEMRALFGEKKKKEKEKEEDRIGGRKTRVPRRFAPHKDRGR